MSDGLPVPSSEVEGVGEGLQSLVRMLRILFLVLRVLIVVIMVYLFFSGVFYVRDHEEAMLFRFGELQQRDGKEILTSGNWYWAWPYPIDRVRRVPAQRSVTLTSTQFWPLTNPNQLAPAAPPPASGEAQGLRAGEGGYVLTGDANIMHMTWTITYRVSNAKKYYLNFYGESENWLAPAPGAPGKGRGADAAIKSALDQAVLTEVSSWPAEDVLVLSRAEAGDRRREALANTVESRLLALLNRLDLGIEVQQVSLFEVQPPLATQTAFREVVDASQDYQTEIDNARAYEKGVVTMAEGRASKVIADAKAYRTRGVESVKAESAYFEKVLAEYRKNPRTMLVALYTDAIRDVLNQVENKYVIHSSRNGRQEVRLLLGPEPKKPGAAGAIPAPSE